jgi:cysteine-rich repeat protein
MRRPVVIFALVCIAQLGCLDPATLTCPDSTICPRGTKCVEGGCALASCGDGVQNPGETCDDGNNVPGDGCSSDCIGTGSVCGDMRVDDDEACDPPNVNRCSDDCTRRYICGDGARDPGEVCDPPDVDRCSADCSKLHICGDNIVDPNEVCDPPNTNRCNGDCTRLYRCGNGLIDPGEDCDDNNLRSRDGCSSSCQLEFPRWISTSRAPSPRLDAAIAFDRDRGKLVLFGGCLANQGTSCTGTLLSDTWEWDGLVWERVGVQAAIIPGPRYGAAMAYDSARKRVVMFAGHQGNGAVQYDTWEWDGERWHLLSTTGPPGRGNGGMVYDEVRREILLVGGGSQTDVWSWNGIAWSQRAATAPVTPIPSMTFDPQVGRIVSFTGAALTSWDGANWTPIVGSEFPGSRRNGALVWFDPRRGGLTLAGGCPVLDTNCITPFTDVWSWDGTQWYQRNETVPPRGHARAVHDVGADRTLVFGGIANGVLTNELLESSNGFTPRTAPSARAGAATTYDVDRAAVVLFGGEDETGVLDDVWEWNGEQWRRRLVSSGPSPRRNASLAYDPQNGLVLHGGRDTAPLGDTWTLDTVWTERASPAGLQPRSEAAMAYFAKNAFVVLDGIEECPWWMWNASSSWTRGGGTCPGNRAGAVMAYLPREGGLFMIGGSRLGSHQVYDWHMYILMGGWSTWWSVSPIGAFPSAAADPLRDVVVVFGGRTSGNTSGDTWQLSNSGHSWTPLATPVSPPARSEAVMAYDPRRRQSVLFGGLLANGTLDQETWIFRIEASQPRDERCVDGLDGDGDGLVGCADPDCAGTCNPAAVVWGIGPHVSTASCGDLTCDPHETCAMCSVDCGACDLCGDGVCDVLESCSDCPGDCGACP